MNTRIIVASLALAAGGLGLTACSSNTPAPFPAPAPVTVHDTPTQAPVTQAPPVSQAPAQTATGDPQSNNDQAFLSVLRQRAVFLDGSDSGQISLGHSACTAMEAGVSLTDLVSLGAQDNISAYDMGWLLGAAQSAYCPSVTIPGT